MTIGDDLRYIANTVDMTLQNQALGLAAKDAQIADLTAALAADEAEIADLEQQLAETVFPGMTVHFGDLALTDPGDVRDGLVVVGKVTRAARDCGLKRSVVLGPLVKPAAWTACINLDQAGYDGDGFLAEDVTVKAQTPSPYLDGIGGNNFTARRVNISGTTDGIRARAKNLTNGACNVHIEDPWIHDLIWWANDPQQTDGSHCDGIQYEGGDGLTVVGGLLECYVRSGDTSPVNRPTATAGVGYGGSAFILNENVKNASSAYMRASNWSLKDVTFRGGYAQVNLSSRFSPLPGTLTNLTFGRDIFDNYPANPDKRWVCLKTGVTYQIPALGTGELKFEDGPTLTYGRASGIRQL